MSLPRIANKDEWLAARKELLTKEKELTRRRDELNTERRNLPRVEVTEDYRFDGPDAAVCREVRLDDFRRDPMGLADFCGKRLEPVFSPGDQDEFVAIFGKPAGESLANASRCSGDKGSSCCLLRGHSAPP